MHIKDLKMRLLYRFIQNLTDEEVEYVIENFKKIVLDYFEVRG